MVNFIEDCPKAILLPYLEPYCAKMEQVLMAKTQEVSKLHFTVKTFKLSIRSVPCLSWLQKERKSCWNRL